MVRYRARRKKGNYKLTATILAERVRDFQRKFKTLDHPGLEELIEGTLRRRQWRD